MLRCILVDDDRWALVDMRGSFPFAHFEIEIAGCYLNAEDALDAMRKDPPDLVITDVCMREGSGLDLLCASRKAGINARFIIVSGHDNFAYAQTALNQGAAYYLLKPINPNEAALALEKAVSGFPAEAAKDFKAASGFEGALNYVNEHYADSFTLTELAGRFYLNMNYLSDQFTKKTGCTFTQYRNKLRVARARSLLDAGWQPADVARKVGFEDVRYFARVFQQTTGITPMRYRKGNSNET